MRWNPQHEHDRRVINIGGWHEITKVEAHFPDCAGVYVFADADLHVKYVGKAGARRLRVQARDACMSHHKCEGATLAGWLVTESGDAALELETLLIAIYRPPNNVR